MPRAQVSLSKEEVKETIALIEKSKDYDVIDLIATDPKTAEKIFQLMNSKFTYTFPRELSGITIVELHNFVMRVGRERFYQFVGEEIRNPDQSFDHIRLLLSFIPEIKESILQLKKTLAIFSAYQMDSNQQKSNNEDAKKEAVDEVVKGIRKEVSRWLVENTRDPENVQREFKAICDAHDLDPKTNKRFDNFHVAVWQQLPLEKLLLDFPRERQRNANLTVTITNRLNRLNLQSWPVLFFMNQQNKAFQPFALQHPCFFRRGMDKEGIQLDVMQEDNNKHFLRKK